MLHLTSTKPGASPNSAGGAAGAKRALGGDAGASKRPAKKAKKAKSANDAVPIVPAENFVTKLAGALRAVFGPTKSEQQLEKTASVLRKHKDLAKLQLKNCNDRLIVSRSQNRALLEQLAVQEEQYRRNEDTASAAKKDLKRVVKKFRHEKAKLELEKATLEREKAMLELEKAMLEQEKAKLKQEKATLEEENAKLDAHITQHKAAQRVARMLE